MAREEGHVIGVVFLAIAHASDEWGPIERDWPLRKLLKKESFVTHRSVTRAARKRELIVGPFVAVVAVAAACRRRCLPPLLLERQ